MSQARIDLRLIVNQDNGELRRLYLQYVNDFLTYDGVARYYGWNAEFTKKSICAGRIAHENHCARIKQRESV